MPLIALASVKGSPGVTTTCLALAAAWPGKRRLVIEADPAGGDLGPWLGLPPAPGLTGLAAAARHAGSIFASLAAGPETVIADCGRLDPGSPALAVAAQAEVTLLMVRPRVSEL